MTDYVKWASNSMSWFQLTQRKLLWFQEHARLPEAQWSHNGNHRQKCRLTGHEDDRLSTEQTKKLWMFARLLRLTSAAFLCPALVFETSVPGHVKRPGKVITSLRYTCTSWPYQTRYWENTPAPFSRWAKGYGESVTRKIISFPQQEQHGLVQLFV